MNPAEFEKKLIEERHEMFHNVMTSLMSNRVLVAIEFDKTDGFRSSTLSQLMSVVDQLIVQEYKECYVSLDIMRVMDEFFTLLTFPKRQPEMCDQGYIDQGLLMELGFPIYLGRSFLIRDRATTVKVLERINGHIVSGRLGRHPLPDIAPQHFELMG